MSRVGWVVLAIMVLVIAGFASMVRVGGEPVARSTVAARAPAPRPLSSASVPDDLAVVPVLNVLRSELRDDWADPRDGGARAHHGIDIPAPNGTAVIAVALGTVEKLFASDRGGTTIYQRSRDGRWCYYYAHLAGYAAGLHEGQRLGPGEVIGYVGDTGDAGPGNYHLHFGLSRVIRGARWWQGVDVDPYPWLAGRAGPR